MSSRDAHHGFGRSLRARIAGANEPSRKAWLDRHRHQLWGIVSIRWRLSRLNARDACLLRCHAQRNEAGRYPASRTDRRPRDDRSLSVAAPKVKPLREQSHDLRFNESCRSAPSAHPKDGSSCPPRWSRFFWRAHIRAALMSSRCSPRQSPLKRPQALAHCGSPGSKIEC
jgi:hypothetical protein